MAAAQPPSHRIRRVHGLAGHNRAARLERTQPRNRAGLFHGHQRTSRAGSAGGRSVGGSLERPLAHQLAEGKAEAGSVTSGTVPTVARPIALVRALTAA